MTKEIKTDISIVGAGVTGLYLTQKLTDMGYKVAIVEKQRTVALGPSTKNEGWLHRGTYHATSIKDGRQAQQVARRCIYGYDQIRQFAPEAIEDPDHPSYAVLTEEINSDGVQERWENAGVRYRAVSRKHFSDNNPDVNMDGLSTAFEVADVSINTRILYHKLLMQSRRNGADIFLDTQFMPVDSENAHLETREGEQVALRSDLFIVTAGTGINGLYQDLTGDDLPLRYWKSHLLTFPRLTTNNVFSLAPGDAALFNHTSTSVVGRHEDATLIHQPDFTVIEEQERRVYEATAKLFPNAKMYEDRYMPIACIKPDIQTKSGQARSLDITVFEPSPNYVFVLPGKMTEAPFVADKVIQTLYSREGTTSDIVAFRPCDNYARACMLESVPVS